MGISPEVEEVEGVGRSHVYSLKNLLEFAYAHTASEIGLTPNVVRKFLSLLHFLDKTYSAGIFARGELVLSVSYVVAEANRFFYVTGEGQELGLTQGYFPVAGFPLDILKSLRAGKKIGPEAGMKAIAQINGAMAKPDDATALVRINLGAVKKAALRNI
jgi:hypothetical protein